MEGNIHFNEIKRKKLIYSVPKEFSLIDHATGHTVIIGEKVRRKIENSALCVYIPLQYTL